MIYSRDSYINQPLVIEKELKTLFNPDHELTIFEIGACEGEDSIKYSLLFKNARIYAFEPFPENVALVKKNLTKYKVQNIVVIDKALSLNEGIAEFHLSGGRPENAPESDWDYGNKSSSLLLPDKHIEMAPFINFNKKIAIETTTIEVFCKSNNLAIIDYIHMDVQGAELMVLQGAGEFINSIKAIWLEVAKIHLYKDQPLVGDINKFMTANNFVLAKNCLDDIQGDQLYISKFFFPDYKNIVKKLDVKPPSLLKRIKNKLKI